jgi:hypothetical protein
MESEIAAAGSAATKESGDLVAVAADGHGTPAAAMRAGIIVKEKAAGGVSATADGSAGAFDQEFSSRASESGQEPVEAALTGDKLEGPDAFMGDELIVTFGDAKDFVNGLDPGSGEGFTLRERSKDGAERLAKTKNAEQDGVNGLRFGSEQGAETRGTIFRDQARINQERDELVPREIVGGGREVGEIESEATSDEVWGGRRGGGHVTSDYLQGGYIRRSRSCNRIPEALGRGLAYSVLNLKVLRDWGKKIGRAQVGEMRRHERTGLVRSTCKFIRPIEKIAAALACGRADS